MAKIYGRLPDRIISLYTKQLLAGGADQRPPIATVAANAVEK